MSMRLAVRNWIAAGLLLQGGAFANSADIYDIDPRHTFSTFEYEHWGLSRQQGRFDATRGFIAYSAETGSGEIDIEIDVASVNAGNPSFNELLRSAEFFDAENHPTIVFKSTALRFDGERLSEVVGDLRIKGITHPVTLKISHFRCRFMPLYGARACGANASTSILRSDFDLGRYIPFVSDRVDLAIAVEAIRRNPAEEE